MSEEPTLSSIHSRIVELTGEVKGHMNLTQERLDRVGDRMEGVQLELYGNGTDASPGQKVKVDRNTRTIAIFIWVISTMATAVGGLLVNAVFKMIKQ